MTGIQPHRRTRLAEIMDAISSSPTALSQRELARMVGVSQYTMHGDIRLLVEMGYLDHPFHASRALRVKVRFYPLQDGMVRK